MTAPKKTQPATGTVTGSTSSTGSAGTGSNFATRRAEREAREAAGDEPEPYRPRSFRAGVDAENPLLRVTHVQA